MILPKIQIGNLANKTLAHYSPDTLEDCYDRRHFKRYPHEISYKFNSRGFRDTEWPEDLSNAIWCIGDSVTVGLGAPASHTYTHLLEQATGMRTINLGIRGTNNATISHIAREVITTVAPRNVVIMWSIFERRPVDPFDLMQDKMSTHLIADEADHLRHFEQCVSYLDRGITNIIHGYVPRNFSLSLNTAENIWNDLRDPSWGTLPRTISDISPRIVDELKTVHRVWPEFATAMYYRQLSNSLPNFIGEITPRDLARDGAHFDIATSREVVAQIAEHLI